MGCSCLFEPTCALSLDGGPKSAPPEAAVENPHQQRDSVMKPTFPRAEIDGRERLLNYGTSSTSYCVSTCWKNSHADGVSSL